MVTNYVFYVTESPEVAEIVRQANAEAEKRRKHAILLREAVKTALRYNIPWTVNVLENFTSYMRKITPRTIPRIALNSDDVILESSIVQGNQLDICLCDNFMYV